MKSRRSKYLAISGAVVLIAVIVVLVVLLVGGGKGPKTTEETSIPGVPSDEERTVTDKVWGATLVLHIPIDPEQADQPADVTLLDSNIFLVDTARGRLVELSADGKTSNVLDKEVDPKLALSIPMAIASYQGQLYVADSGSGQVLVVAPSGTVTKAISLAKGSSADALPPRPLGIVVWPDGSFAVSDANNHRLLKYDPDGNLLWSVGTGVRGEGENGFNVPSGLALDKQGNVYVVDVLNSQLKKYSADGTFLSSFGGAGDRAGQFSRAKAVAVDDAGNIYVSDGLQLAVQVFDQEGTYLGFVGRKDPADPKSEPLFRAPHGVKIIDGKLYVVDRYAGLFEFDLPAASQQTASR